MAQKQHYDEQTADEGRKADDERKKAGQQMVDDRKAGALAERDIDHDEMARMRAEDPLFIEKTRPEDPSGRPGQLTRDMPQGGVAPVGLMKPENPIGAHFEDARYDHLNEVGERKGQIEQKYHDDLANLNKEENERSKKAVIGGDRK
jgi:hypothetical protein